MRRLRTGPVALATSLILAYMITAVGYALAGERLAFGLLTAPYAAVALGVVTPIVALGSFAVELVLGLILGDGEGQAVGDTLVTTYALPSVTIAFVAVARLLQVTRPPPG
jgi:hypothetical protein